MHGHKLLGGKVLAFPLKHMTDAGPPVGGDALAIAPFLRAPLGNANVIGHFRDGPPAVKNVFDGFHYQEYAGDGLSRQQGKTIPLASAMRTRTICPMGRGTTPRRFKDDFADRLRSARVAAGYETQAQFALALGVTHERYKKWESGRTPIPHQYVPLACELLDKDANYLFRVAAKVMRKAG
jgi:DNA-binding XRE family transcriptional regulator